MRKTGSIGTWGSGYIAGVGRPPISTDVASIRALVRPIAPDPKG